jgi:hypothetical protein
MSNNPGFPAREARAQRSPPEKRVEFPQVIVRLALNYDGGIIVSAQVVVGQRLNYDGGVIGTV